MREGEIVSDEGFLQLGRRVPCRDIGCRTGNVKSTEWAALHNFISCATSFIPTQYIVPQKALSYRFCDMAVGEFTQPMRSLFEGLCSMNVRYNNIQNLSQTQGLLIHL